MESTPNFFENPKFLAEEIKQIQDGIGSRELTCIIKEGIADGSIKAENPSELAEVIIVFVKIWINPNILGNERKKIPAQCKIINEFLKNYNILLFDKEIINLLLD